MRSQSNSRDVQRGQEENNSFRLLIPFRLPENSPIGKARVAIAPSFGPELQLLPLSTCIVNLVEGARDMAGAIAPKQRVPRHSNLECRSTIAEIVQRNAI